MLMRPGRATGYSRRPEATPDVLADTVRPVGVTRALRRHHPVDISENSTGSERGEHRALSLTSRRLEFDMDEAVEGQSYLREPLHVHVILTGVVGYSRDRIAVCH
jgi:hypothetical protein